MNPGLTLAIFQNGYCTTKQYGFAEKSDELPWAPRHWTRPENLGSRLHGATLVNHGFRGVDFIVGLSWYII